MNKNNFTPVTKGGRCWNGFHQDRGKIVHLIEGEEPNGYWGGKSLCGIEPGLRSYGWSKALKFIDRENIVNAEVTCQKCLDKLNKFLSNKD